MKRHFTNEETHKITKYDITSVRMGSAQFFSTFFYVPTLVQLLQETVWHDIVKLQKWSLSMSTRKYVQNAFFMRT